MAHELKGALAPLFQVLFFIWRRVIWHGKVWYVHTSGWYKTELVHEELVELVQLVELRQLVELAELVHERLVHEEATRWLANLGWQRVFWHGAVWYVHTSGWYQREHPATTRHKIVQCYHCRNTDPTWCCACPRHRSRCREQRTSKLLY